MYPKCTRFVPAPVLPGMGGVLPDKKKLCKIAIFRQIYWAILGCVGSSPTSGANFTLARYHRLILLKTHSPQHQNRAILPPVCFRSVQFGNFSDNRKETRR